MLRCGRHQAAGMPGRGRQRGSALLLVLGATAVLSALALATLSLSLLAYDVAVLEHQGEQARLLARTGLDLAFEELAAGRLPVPPPGLETSWRPALPPPPPGAPPLPVGCGVAVRLSRVRSSSPVVLVEALAEGRCGRGLQQRRGRFERRADGALLRLY